MDITRVFGMYKPDRNDTVSVSRDVSGNMQIIDDAFEAVENMIATAQNSSVATKFLYKGQIIIKNGVFFKVFANTPEGTEFHEVNLATEVTPGSIAPLSEYEFKNIYEHFRDYCRSIEYKLQNLYGAEHYVLDDDEYEDVYYEAGCTYIVLTTGKNANQMGAYLVYCYEYDIPEPGGGYTVIDRCTILKLAAGTNNTITLTAQTGEPGGILFTSTSTNDTDIYKIKLTPSFSYYGDDNLEGGQISS